MALMDFLFGGKDKIKKLDTLDPQQKQFLSQLMQMIGGQGGTGQGFNESTDYLRQLMDPSSQAAEQFAAPYKQQFEQETVPMLAERFAGLGGGMGGGLSSSGFGQALGAAGGNLQTQLAALKASLGQQAAGQLMGSYQNLAGLGLGTKPFGYQQKQGSQGLIPSAINSWSQGGFGGAGAGWDKLLQLIGGM